MEEEWSVDNWSPHEFLFTHRGIRDLLPSLTSFPVCLNVRVSVPGNPSPPPNESIRYRYSLTSPTPLPSSLQVPLAKSGRTPAWIIYARSQAYPESINQSVHIKLPGPAAIESRRDPKARRKPSIFLISLNLVQILPFKSNPRNWRNGN